MVVEYRCLTCDTGPTSEARACLAEGHRVEERAAWSACKPCDGTGVVYAAGPDYFGNYDSDDCPTCLGHGAVPPSHIEADS